GLDSIQVLRSSSRCLAGGPGTVAARLRAGGRPLPRKPDMSHFGSAISSPSAMGGKPAALLAALLASAVALASCARQQNPQDAHAGPARPQPAYCQPRPAPDCEFRNASLRTVDPAEFARLKLAYERR